MVSIPCFLVCTLLGAASPGVLTVDGKQLIVRSDPSGASLELDGVVLGHTPITVPIPSGTHRLTLRLEGYVAERKRLVVEEEAEIRVTLALMPKARLHSRVFGIVGASSLVNGLVLLPFAILLFPFDGGGDAVGGRVSVSAASLLHIVAGVVLLAEASRLRRKSYTMLATTP